MLKEIWEAGKLGELAKAEEIGEKSGIGGGTGSGTGNGNGEVWVRAGRDR